LASFTKSQAEGRRSGRKRPPVDYRDDKPLEALYVEESEDQDDDSAGGGGKGKKKKLSGPSQASKYAPLVLDERKPVPEKNGQGELVFEDYPHFRPNLTPKEVGATFLV
jgi:hypothetical protein